MRQNLPVSQREYPFPDGVTLMSTTDMHSHITYANEAFIDVSGFSRDEILDQPHNMVRHPDMPVEAFADMWATLQRGQSWTALVKNRRKDGDHYWVRANATPMQRNGQVTGYLSVRTRPQAQEVQQAESLYRRFREGKAGSLAFHRGLVVRTGLMVWTSLPQRLSVRGRIRLVSGLAAALPLAAAAAAGVAGLPLAVLAGTLAVSALGAAALLERQIAAPLGQILAQAQSVACGEAGRSMHLDRVDDIGMLLRAVNQSGLNLRALIDDVDQRARSVDRSSRELASGSMALSGRTEEQASALEETAASMEELSSTVEHNAGNAREGRELALKAQDVAAGGGTVVGQLVTAMHDIQGASRRIADIAGVIDSIAFQTNILALNAAVESARAGEQSRGFAVVASEVRALAGRSAEAAHEIKGLIAENVQRVTHGSALADQAGATMQQMLGSIRRVSDIMDEISTASAEQSSGVSQIGEVISQMDLVTQQNAAMVEESAAAADSLKAQADQLVGTVAVFQTQQRPADGGAYRGVERRGPNRATNVTRIHPGKPSQPRQPMVRTRAEALPRQRAL